MCFLLFSGQMHQKSSSASRGLADEDADRNTGMDHLGAPLRNLSRDSAEIQPAVNYGTS
jgi:hypothetical protein